MNCSILDTGIEFYSETLPSDAQEDPCGLWLRIRDASNIFQDLKILGLDACCLEAQQIIVNALSFVMI